MSPPILADGSAQADAPTRVRIDRADDLDRWRYRCPNGHTTWEPTNNHLWCHKCSQLADADEGPEYYEILDARTDERIPWSAVELV